MLLKLPNNFYCKEEIIVILLKIKQSTMNNKKKNIRIINNVYGKPQ